MKYKYWLRYQSLGFFAEIIKAPAHLTAEDIDYAYSGELEAFDSLREARIAAFHQTNGDIDEFREMKKNINKKPRTYVPGAK